MCGFVLWLKTWLSWSLIPERNKERIETFVGYWVIKSEIKSDQDLVYGDNALTYCTIARWVSVFKGGRTNDKDKPSPGRPISATFETDISTVQDIDKEDARFGGDKWHIWPLCVTSLGQFVPVLLTPDQKRDQVESLLSGQKPLNYCLCFKIESLNALQKLSQGKKSGFSWARQ